MQWSGLLAAVPTDGTDMAGACWHRVSRCLRELAQQTCTCKGQPGGGEHAPCGLRPTSLPPQQCLLVTAAHNDAGAPLAVRLHWLLRRLAAFMSWRPCADLRHRCTCRRRHLAAGGCLQAGLVTAQAC